MDAHCLQQLLYNFSTSTRSHFLLQGHTTFNKYGCFPPNVSGRALIRREQQHCKLYSLVFTGNVSIERFSFECRKVIGFAFTTLRDWFKNFAPLFHPIRSKTKTNRDSPVRVFPHFTSATCRGFNNFWCRRLC